MRYAVVIAALVAVLNAGIAQKALAGSDRIKCRTGDAHVKMMDITGHLAQEWRYDLNYSWCFNGTRITKIENVYTYGTGTWPWSFKGNLPGSPEFNPTPNSFTSTIFVQGDFEASLPVFHIGFRSRQPWIRLTLRADGKAMIEWRKG